MHVLLQVLSVELLLAALEACGVDNARIEVEGGHEIPVLDNSALGWCVEVQVRPSFHIHNKLHPLCTVYMYYKLHKAGELCTPLVWCVTGKGCGNRRIGCGAGRVVCSS